MFTCKSCELLQDEVRFLREEMGRLTDRLMALTNPSAYQAVSFTPPSGDFYGSESDEMVEHNYMGGRVLVTKKQ